MLIVACLPSIAPNPKRRPIRKVNKSTSLHRLPGKISFHRNTHREKKNKKWILFKLRMMTVALQTFQPSAHRQKNIYELPKPLDSQDVKFNHYSLWFKERPMLNSKELHSGQRGAAGNTGPGGKCFAARAEYFYPEDSPISRHKASESNKLYL